MGLTVSTPPGLWQSERVLFSGEPTWAVPIPTAVRILAAGADTTAVWCNQRDGMTFRLGSGPGRRFVKWSPRGGTDLRREADRLHWAAAYVAVPEVLSLGSDDEGSWMETVGLPGENAVVPRWRADPASAVVAIGRGLRELHDRAPVSDCPYSWSQPDRLTEIRGRATPADPLSWQAAHRHLTVDQAMVRLADPPPVDLLVVCHGDACAPNTLLDEHGTCSGRVDLGALGVADRWADLAVATWSTQWNYGPGWEQLLLDAYGIGADDRRTNYYRLLWDLGP